MLGHQHKTKSPWMGDAYSEEFRTVSALSDLEDWTSIEEARRWYLDLVGVPQIILRRRVEKPASHLTLVSSDKLVNEQEARFSGKGTE